jgi:AcrR family transcriptional regulator
MCQDAIVPSKARRAERRDDALTKEAIVNAAIELLDVEGEGGLTFRALTAKLATGAGAIYWHVANKDELLAAATDVVVAVAIAGHASDATPKEAIRAVAIGVFDAIDAHPWVGAQLARAPWLAAMLNIFERIGRSVQALGVPPADQFTAASSLVSYILGVGSQNAANAVTARAHLPNTDRAEFLAGMAAAWAALDADEYAFTRAMAGPLRDHDDRAEFLAGIDLIVAGIAAGRRTPSAQRR